jgi:hypothetical protein
MLLISCLKEVIFLFTPLDSLYLLSSKEVSLGRSVFMAPVIALAASILL